MAVLPDASYSEKPGNWSVNIGSIGDPQAGINTAIDVAALAPFKFGTVPYKSNSGPLPTRAPCPGTPIGSYGDLWFGRIHVLPPSVDLQNVLVDVSGTFEVFSAFLDSPKTLASANGLNDAGITLNPPSPVPFQIAQIESVIFGYDVTTNGPATIQAIYLLDFGPAGVPTFSLTGNRSVVFPFPPENPLGERIQFVTDIIEARDGTEQRSMARPKARQSFEASYLLSDAQQIASANNLLAGHGGNFFGMPLWQYSRRLLADAPATSTVISVDTTLAEFRDGEQVILWSGWNSFEVGIIQSQTTTTITLSIPTTNSFDAIDTYVLPLQFALAEDIPEFERYQNNVTSVGVVWNSADVIDYTDISSLPLYFGVPLIDGFNFMQGSTIKEGQRVGYSLTDYKTGVFAPINPRTVTNTISQKTWSPENAQDLWNLRGFLYWMRGRLRAWWMPTFREDFQATAPIGPADTVITVKNVSYTRLVGSGNAPFTDIYIILKDGTTFARDITDSVESLDGLTENLTIGAPLGQTIQPSEIHAISFLGLVRSNTDSIGVTHTGQGRAAVSIPVIGVPQ